MEAATSVSSEEERIDDEPCFDVNVVEEQSPSGVASGGEVTSAAGDMVQCQSRPGNIVILSDAVQQAGFQSSVW